MSDFYGLPTVSLENEWIRIEYLATAGPRLVRLFTPGFEGNLLAETPQTEWETPHGVFHLRGGHRLWTAPETLEVSSYPDNEGVVVEEFPGGVRLIGPVATNTGLQKIIEVTLLPGCPALRLAHRVENRGEQALELAPWAITQLRLGGTARIPQPPIEESGLTPNRNFALWPYARWDDPRLHLEDEFVRVDGISSPQAFKLGCLNTIGWLEYTIENLTFRKSFPSQPAALHTDRGCNAEVYVRDTCLELETLGPLQRLSPGEVAEHVETWELNLS